MTTIKSDKTIERKVIALYLSHIQDYELIKQKKHPEYRYVKELWKAKGIEYRSFLKYYKRYKESKENEALLPQKRGPKKQKWRKGMILPFIEQKILQARGKGMNKYEIYNHLSYTLPNTYTPSHSSIYRILCKYNMNIMKPKQQENKRKIIKERMGELLHVDCNTIPFGMVGPLQEKKRYYLVGIIDSCTRLTWVEVVEDKKALTVMFATMRCLQMLHQRYGLQAEEMITDNGSEFGKKDMSDESKKQHPFECMLMHMGITHRYTRPYRPQTNGKIERFWKTIHEDMMNAEVLYSSQEELQKELFEYMVYYNDYRPHSVLPHAMSPRNFAASLPNSPTIPVEIPKDFFSSSL